jgi:dipeptidyl aminopeptidase/acylaminoacyl peptidase
MPLRGEVQVQIPRFPIRYLREVGKTEGLARYAALQLPRFLAAGGQWADLATAIGRMHPLDQWVAEWRKLGDTYSAGAQALRSLAAWSAARHAYALAALYYHYAHMLIVPPDAERTRLLDRAMAAYEEVGSLSRPQPIRLEVPYSHGYLPGYLWPGIAHTPAPTVILLHGGDSGKPEMLRWVDEFRHRGLGVFSVDMPGQAETVTRWGLVMAAPAREVPVALHAIIDTLSQCSEVDSHRIALAGECFGAFMVLLGAGVLPDLRAVAVVAPRMEPNHNLHTDDEGGRRVWDIVTGGRTEPWEYDLPQAIAAVQAPLIVVAGEDDRSCPARVWPELLVRTGGPAELVHVVGGVAVLTNAWVISRPLIVDWLARYLDVA